jgi:hypothetical protein
MWFQYRKEILTKDNLIKRNVKNVAFVIMMRQFNTSLLNALLQSLFEVLPLSRFISLVRIPRLSF